MVKNLKVEIKLKHFKIIKKRYFDWPKQNLLRQITSSRKNQNSGCILIQDGEKESQLYIALRWECLTRCHDDAGILAFPDNKSCKFSAKKKKKRIK